MGVWCVVCGGFGIDWYRWRSFLFAGASAYPLFVALAVVVLLVKPPFYRSLSYVLLLL